MFAPNIEQMHVVNHLKGEPAEEKRNVLVESARLARGNIQDLSKLSVKDHDAVIFPGLGNILLSPHICTNKNRSWIFVIFASQVVSEQQRTSARGRCRGRTAPWTTRWRRLCRRSTARANPSASAASHPSWLPRCFRGVRSLLAWKRMRGRSDGCNPEICNLLLWKSHLGRFLTIIEYKSTIVFWHTYINRKCLFF